MDGEREGRGREGRSSDLHSSDFWTGIYGLLVYDFQHYFFFRDARVSGHCRGGGKRAARGVAALPCRVPTGRGGVGFKVRVIGGVVKRPLVSLKPPPRPARGRAPPPPRCLT